MKKALVTVLSFRRYFDFERENFYSSYGIIEMLLWMSE